MNIIDTNKVYYDTFKLDGESKMMAYKVISIVFDIETELYTLKLNVAQKGVRTFRYSSWDFYTSPSDVMTDTCCYKLTALLKDLQSDKPHVINFINQLKKEGFEIQNGVVKYYYLIGSRINWFSKKIKESGDTIPFIIGTYNLLTDEVKAKFNPRARLGYGEGKVLYKTQQECLDNNMPEVVEFGDNTPKDVEISFNFNVTIKAKDAKEAQRKLSLMLQMAQSE